MADDKAAVSLKVMRERGMPGVATVKSWGLDPRIIKIRPGFNRPISREQVESIKISLRAGATLDDIKVEVEDGVILMVDGEHRWTAVMEWLSEPGTQEPPDGYKMGAKQVRLSDAERVVHLITSSQGLGLTPLQRSEKYRLLAGWQWTPKQIADAVGFSENSVRDALVLSGANSDVKQAVTENKISATSATKLVRKHQSKAGAVIEQHLEEAKLQGKPSVTAKQIEGNTPRDLVNAIKKDRESGGTFKAEDLAPYFKDLILYLRGAGK